MVEAQIPEVSLVDPKTKYPEPRLPPARLKSTITPIYADLDHAAAMTVMRTFDVGIEDRQRQLDLMISGDFLGNADLRGRGPRAADIQARHNMKLKAAGPQKVLEPVRGDYPAAVVQALESLRSTTPMSRRVDRPALRAQLQDEIGVLREGQFALHTVLAQILDLRSMELARRLAKQHRDLVVAQYRTAQALAHATDQLREFHKSIAESGHTARPDLLQGTPGRACLILGSEGDASSEITAMRIALERMGAL
jgi:hypothetical protein